MAFSPRQTTRFVGVQENGAVCIWDLRQEARPWLTFQGHSCCILTVDWHSATSCSADEGWVTLFWLSNLRIILFANDISGIFVSWSSFTKADNSSCTVLVLTFAIKRS
ncbi:unnamed protein product [Protopolystoma xenopodis]|uniref:GATOR complex protein WDR24 n=1 Tax=Protopolystoma xenopodis TaxID=117903 RepID=A0A3S5CNJ9_9PLAT|nr:unnamed protein product [Protopolystoma xenopodis]